MCNDQLKAIKSFAAKQWERLGETGDSEGMIGFVHEGQFIITPWIDPSGRFELSDEEAEETYGKDSVERYKTRVKQAITKD